MTAKIHLTQTNAFPKILFLFLLLNLAPIVIASTLNPGLRDSLLYDLMVGTVFMAQAVIIVFYFIGFTKAEIKTSYIIIALLFMLFQSITILINYFSYISINYYDYMNVLATFTNFFLFLCIPSKFRMTYKSLEKFLIGIIILGVLASLYNLVINFDGLTNLAQVKNSYEVNFSSFYLNRNSFAQFLFFAIMANTIVVMKRKKWYFYLNYLLFGLNLLITFSRTATVATLVFLLVFFLIYWRKQLLTQFKISTVVITTLVLVFLSSTNREFMSELFIRKEAGTSHRSELWLLGAGILNNTNWVFGVGQHTGIRILQLSGESNSEFHSFYIEMLLMGGLALVGFYVVIFYIIMKNIGIIYKQDRIVGTVYVASLLSFFVYGFFESASFFSLGYVGTLFTIFYITMPLMYANYLRQPKKVPG